MIDIDVVLFLLMAMGLVVFIGEPLLRTAQGVNSTQNYEEERLSLQKETLYTALRDLDFDFQTGKVDQADYVALRQRLETDAVNLLHQIDHLDPLRQLDHNLERQIAALRMPHGRLPSSPLQPRCQSCKTQLAEGGHFCPCCGQPVA